MKNLAIALWAAQVLAAGTMLVATAIEIRTIVWSAPALSLVGLAFAAVTRQLNLWSPLAFGVSGPLVCALVATLIVINDWSPREAQRPISILLAVCIFSAFPLGVASLRSVLRWQIVVLPGERRAWQYSLKSMLIWMTAVCVLAAGGQYVVGRLATGHVRIDEYIFIGFALTAILLSGTVLWRFLANRRMRAWASKSNESMSDRE